MIVPLLLMLLALAGLAVALILPEWRDLILLAGPVALASLYLLIRAWRGRLPRRPHILIDGSNVMHWKEGGPDIATVRDVVSILVRMGYDPGVVFDANVGYKVAGRYKHDQAMGRMLGLPADKVLVAGKGTQADPLLLAAARDLGARIVSNDRYRDRAAAHPEVMRRDFLVRGGYRDGALWLDIDPVTPPT